jgi:hypothetical protein
MAEINDLIFNDLEVENDFRWLLKQRFLEDDVNDLYDKEINFIPIDSDLKSKVELPAVTFSLYQGKSTNRDDEQLQRYTPFTVEINVYTSGDSKVLKNRQLCNMIIAVLQSNGQLPNYFCRGLYLDENNEITTMMESAYRRVIRMSGLCDNKLKLIK